MARHWSKRTLARTTPGPDFNVLPAYLEHGGSGLMLIEPDYAVDETLEPALAEARIRLGKEFVVDPDVYYFTDDQMIAVTNTRHPIARAGNVDLSWCASGGGDSSGDSDGAGRSRSPPRPKDCSVGQAVVLFATSAQSDRITARLKERKG